MSGSHSLPFSYVMVIDPKVFGVLGDRRLIYAILGSQIIAITAKLYLGVDEYFLIGTFTHKAGELGLLIPVYRSV